ncbi:MAG: hypothetical protein FJ358_02665 [Thaumarchaeota archaeon]|nr:hypothetical protein [Nitrososphaerota archaeon]
MVGRKIIHVAITLLSILQFQHAYAHGFGAIADLPVPAYLYWFGGGAAVVVSFIVISLFVGKSDNANGDYRRYNILKHARVRGLSKNKVILNLIKLSAVCLLFLSIATGLFGSQFPELNFTPTFIWVIWWVGFSFLHVIVGNVWSLVNPWKAIFEIFGLGGWDGLFKYPKRLGSWPAFALFFLFVWIELIYPAGANPRSLALVILGYSVVTLVGMYLFGKNVWLKHGEAFSAFFGFLSMIAPIEVRVKDTAICKVCEFDCYRDGGPCINCYACAGKASEPELNLRPFAMGLLQQGRISFDRATFIILMLSSVSFDGLIQTFAWYNFIGLDPFSEGGRLAALQINTVGLIGAFLFFVAIYYTFVYMAKLFSGYKGSPQGLALTLILSLLPIAMVYQFAHYSTYLLINGQQIIALVSDPFGYEWDIFGTRDYAIFRSLDYLTVWNYQVSLIVLGHILAVYAAHKIALKVLRSHKTAIRSQYPMMVLMVIYTVVGLWLLSTPSVG